MKMARSMFPSGPAMLACCFVVLFVIVPVKSQIPPSSPSITGDSTFSVGDTGSFICSSSGGLPDPSVTWYRNGQLVDDTYALTSGQANTGGTVSNTVSFTVSASDHYAVYECQVDNGVTQDPLKLTKFLLVRSTPITPTLVGPNNPPPGQQNTWTCTSVGSFPAATMTMRRGNQQYTNEFTTTQQINAGTKTWTVTGTLAWTPTVANNGDILYCDVAHETLPQPQTVNLPLTVVDPLAVNAPVTSYTPTIGTTVTLNCVVTSGSAASIVWLKDNNVLNINANSRYSNGDVTNPPLTITNVQQSDQGNYVCRAANAQTTVNTNTIVVNPQGTPPVVTIPQPTYTQVKGQSITLVCQVSSPNSPLQAIQWTFTNLQNQLTDPVVISTGNKYTGSSTSSPSLTINNLVEADRGTYRCRGTNLIGSTLSNPTQLSVTGNLPTVQITENPINRIYGSQVTIPCVVSNADPDITNVYWTKNQNGVTTNINSGQNGYSGSTTTTPSLTINFATQADNGIYTCLATNLVGTGTSNPSTVTITGGLLTVQISPAFEEVLQGTTKTITCTVTGQPSATSISWRKTSNTQVTTLDIANSNGKYSGGSTGTPSLTISNFQSSDAASYVCSATNAAGSQSSSTSVLSYKAFPSITVSPTSGSTDIGTATYTITCTVTATPQATTWSWTKTPIGGGQSTTINQGTNDGKYTVANSASSPSLTISNIQTSDQANYVCTATNSAGSRSSGPSQLTVTGGLLGVTIAPSNQMVIRGNSQTITCTITGTPAVQSVTWLKNSQTVTIDGSKYSSGGSTNTPTLTITNFQSSDAATYNCRAANAAGSTLSPNSVLTYGEFLTLQASPSSGSATIGDANYKIDCFISGSPTANSWFWTKTPSSGGQSTTINQGTNSAKYTVDNSATNPSLTIKGIVSTDDANYQCTATNVAGQRTSNNARLLVTGEVPVVTVSQRTYTVTTGLTVQLVCTVTANPSHTQVYWLRSNNVGNQYIYSYTNTNKYSGSTTFQPSLTIYSTTTSDTGQYICLAQNIVGTGQSLPTTLTVSGTAPQVSIPQTSYNVVYGQNAVIPCNIINANPAHTTVTWYRVDNNGQATTINVGDVTQYSGGTLGNPTLTVLNVNNADVGLYRCGATNIVGEGLSGNAQLNVIGGIPVVQLSKTADSVLYGNSITIDCTITYQTPSATKVFWQHTRSGVTTELITTNSNKYSGSTIDFPSLTINNAVHEDDGEYQCFASNIVGVGQSSKLTLNIVGGLLSVTVQQTNSVLYGNTATLTCSVTGSPSATNVFWSKKQNDGSYTAVDVNGNNRYSGGNLNSPNLIISNAVFTDEGVFRCSATNAAGTANSLDANLDVTGNPPTVTISSTSFPVLVGNTITLGCNIISNPPATDVFWTFTNLNNQATVIRQNSNTNKYGGISLQSPSLTINNAAFSDEGKYACSATNIVGTSSSQLADLDVTGQPPTVSIPLPSYSVDFGQQVTITCTVSSNPAHFRVFWRQNKNGVLTEINVANSNGKYSGSTLSSPSLVINNAALDDQASYTCYAENSIGQGSSSPTVLTVRGNIPQVNIQQSLYNVNYGDDVTLVCTVVANPQATSVYWQKLKDGQTTTIDRTAVENDARLSGVTLATPSLTITNVNLNDLASYTCFAQNIVGTGQSSPTSLQVSGAPPTVVVLSTGYAVDVGGQVTLQCVVTSNPVHTSVKWQRLVNGQLQDVTNVGAVGSNSRLTGSTVNSPSLTISQTTFNDEGSYICTATNDVGTGSSQQTFLDVRGTAPTVTIPQSSYAANFGSSFTIPCTVSANPTETRVYWKKLENGAFTDIDMNSARYSGSVVGGPSLTISGLTKADQTFYQCFADNSVGTGSSQQTFLRVDGDPPTVQVSSTSYSVTLGQNAVLGCTVSGNPAVNTVFWRKYNAQNQLVDIDLTTNNNNKYQGSTTTTPTLTILNTVSSDAGRYVCFASNIVGTGQSVVTTLSIVGSIPNVIIPQSSYNVNIGNQITLGCTVSATPQETDVYWTKKVGNGAEQTISKTNSGKYQGQSVASPSLIILNTDLADIATYYCYATNSVGTGKSNPTSLTVTGNIPTVVIPSPSYSVNYGQSTSIPCTVTASPAATSIQWKKLVNGQEQNIDTTQAKYSGATVNSPALTISNADNTDQAIYICTATNSVGTGRSQQTVLNVVGDIPAVSVGSNSYSVLKTQNKVLECTITANPAATSVQWYRVVNGAQTSLRNVQGKYNTPTVNSPNLIINNADDQDRGFYICTASNVVGTGTSQNTYLDVTGNEPIVTIPLSQYNGNIGSSVTINCQVVANPAATSVYWIKTANGQSQTINSGTNRYSFSVNSPSLVISNVVQGDEGNYICYATNVIGTGNSQSTFLDILGSIPQVTILQQSYNTNIGGTSKLECTVTSNPSHTKVYWKKVESNGQTSDIVIDGTKYQGSTLQDPSLTITNAQLSDRTSYICLADNSVGTGQSGQTYLNVIGSQPIVTIPQSTYTVPFGSSIQIPCSITSNPTHTSMSWKRILNGVVTVIDAAYIANNANKYSGGTLNQPSLTINTADRATDQAFYECSASNSVGTGTSSRTFLTVTGSIPVVQIPNNIYPVEIGQSVQIPCTISSDPTHFAVQWQRQDANGAKTNLDVTDQTKYNNGNLGTPTLTILNAANADEGYYLCTATNAVGTGTSSLTYVDVTGSILQVTVPQTSYNVNYGQSVQLVCTVSGTPSATDVYWIKIRNGAQTTIRQSTMDTNKYSGASLGTPSLTILNANEADSALYRCYAQNVVGTGQSQQTQLNVIGSKPTVTVGPPATVNLGNSVTLQCTVIATPSATSVQWNKITNGQPNTVDVGGNPNKYSGGNINVPSLTIFNAQNSDQASYTCQATNAAGTTVSTQTSLTVEGNLPVVTITNQQYSVVVGNSVTLGCTVQANPAHTTVYWRKIVNGQPTALPTSNRYTGSTVSNPSLTINNLVPSDLGNYRCYATNSVGTGQSEQTYLNVVGSIPVVNVVSTSYQTNIGNTVTLGCTVVANPAATNVAWKRLDSNNNIVDINMADAKYTGSQPNSPSLVISNPVKSDEGRYYCTATNLVGTGQSQNTFLTVVGSIPTVTITDPTYSVNRGSTVTLQCSYTSNPVATMVRWTKDGVNLGDVTNNNNYGGSTTSSPSLIIYDANENDEGTYRCEVTNSVGTGTSSATVLNVVGNIPTVTVPIGAYTVLIGGSISLQCSVTADPVHTRVYWQKVVNGNPVELNIDGTKLSGSTVNTPQLNINNAASSDAGTYYCLADNSVGTGRSTQVVVGVTGNKPEVTLTRTTTTANFGDDVVIQCNVVASPAATSVYWQKSVAGGNPVTIDKTNTAKYQGGTVAIPSLTIKNVNLADIGKYTCFAANSVGTGQSTQGDLNVVGSVPQVRVGAGPFTQNIGNSIQISCTVTSNPPHTNVYWTRRIGTANEATIDTASSTKYSVSSDISNPTLTIFNIQETDEGQYTCYATNAVGTGQSTSAYLNVVGNVPAVSASIPAAPVRIGESVVITCTVNSNPAATKIIWQRINSLNNQASNLDMTVAKYSGGTVTTPSLTINPVVEGDEGAYRCQAENDIGTGTSNTVNLLTSGDPPMSVAITPSPIVVQEGNIIAATCTATGNPTPSFAWYKASNMDVVIDTDANLRITNAQESNKGSYVCRATNKFGSNDAIVSVDVQFRPRVVIPELTVVGKRGTNIEIKCTQTSNPLATSVAWTRISNGVVTAIPIDNMKYFGATVLNPSLTITNADASDIGSYRCSATNAVGTGSSENAVVQVDLRYAPIDINIYPDGITVLEGNAFSMYCNSSANPSPTYEWFHDDIKIQTGQTYSVSVSDYNKHDGLYTCKASNEIGFLQKSIDVDVKYPPISNIQQNTFAPVLNSPLTLECDTLANPSSVKWEWYYNDIRMTDYPDNRKDFVVDMNEATDAGKYSCIAFNEVGQSSKIVFTVVVGPVSTQAPITTTAVGPTVAESVASAGLTAGEIAAIILGILFLIFLLIAIIVCCILQGCCICCAAAGGRKEKERRITPDREKVIDIPRFYEVPTVVTREPSLISKRDVSLHMAPAYRPSNDYEITKYRIVRPDDYVDDRYLTSASRPYYLPAIEYTYDAEEERRRRRRKKKRSRRHDDLQRDEQIVVEERVVGGGDVYRTSSRLPEEEVEVVTGPEFYFERE